MFDASKRNGNTLSRFQWDDAQEGSMFGDGISHAKPGYKTRIYALQVRLADSTPMKVHLPAENKKAALKYAKARWPQAMVQHCE